MFSRIEAKHYKCLSGIAVRLEPFNVLVGPNASGKSTFLDVLGFLKDSLESADGVDEAVRVHGGTLSDLVWHHARGHGEQFQLAVESTVPSVLATPTAHNRVRYEVAVGLADDGSIAVRGENLYLVHGTTPAKDDTRPTTRTLFPIEPDDPRPVVRPAHSRTPIGYRLVVRKVASSGNNYFRSENTDWNIQFRLSPQRLALSGVPEDTERFPLALWFRDSLRKNVQTLQLNSVLMRRTSPSDAPRSLQPDGSNLPIMVADLREKSPDRFAWWIEHLQTILEDLDDVRIAERPEDRSRYIVVTYRSGLSVPAWMLSDGSLRVLALTLLAYLPRSDQVYLIEEPENGVHPKAIEGVLRALSSVYDGQVLVATHSPVFLALARPEQLLVFAKTATGATDIVRGPEHPILAEWRQETSLDALFAAGVL